MNGRVFQFGQTTQTSMHTKWNARRHHHTHTQTEGKPEKQRKKRKKSHLNMFASAVALPFSWYFVPNYMNYSGFRFNVFVINIFRIGILTHVLFHSSVSHTHTHTSSISIKILYSGNNERGVINGIWFGPYYILELFIHVSTHTHILRYIQKLYNHYTKTQMQPHILRPERHLFNSRIHEIGHIHVIRRNLENRNRKVTTTPTKELQKKNFFNL